MSFWKRLLVWGGERQTDNRFRPCVESLDGRVLPSASTEILPAVSTTTVSPADPVIDAKLKARLDKIDVSLGLIDGIAKKYAEYRKAYEGVLQELRIVNFDVQEHIKAGGNPADYALQLAVLNRIAGDFKTKMDEQEKAYDEWLPILKDYIDATEKSYPSWKFAGTIPSLEYYYISSPYTDYIPVRGVL